MAAASTPAKRRDCLALLLGLPVTGTGRRELAKWGLYDPAAGLLPAGRDLALRALCEARAVPMSIRHAAAQELRQHGALVGEDLGALFGIDLVPEPIRHEGER